MSSQKNIGDENMITDTYKVTEELEEQGWLYDDTGFYVPYTHKNEEYYDHRNVFLKIERESSNELRYTFVKLENGLFYPMHNYLSPTLIGEVDKKLKRKISNIGNGINLNAGKGIYSEFVDSFRKTIMDSDCLDVLKIEEFEFQNADNLVNLTVPYEKDKHHNFMTMMDLAKLVLGEPYYDYSNKGYTMHLCPFHDDHKPSGKASYHVFRCYKEHIQLDQTGFLMKHFNLDTPQEAEEKFQELLQ